MCSIYAQKHSIDTLHIFYQFDESTLARESKLILDEYMKNINSQKDSVEIDILGYTDKKGSNEYNLKLSQNRANSIEKYLSNIGVNTTFIQSVKGYGKTDISQVLPSRMTDSLCRRVDIYISYISKPSNNIASKKSTKNTSTKKVVEEYVPILTLDDFKRGQKLNIPNLLFYPCQHRLYEDSYNELKNIAKILKENPYIEIQINGHVCCLEDTMQDGYDMQTKTWDLSVRRAKAIYDFFRSYSIDRSRINYKGLSDTQKIVENEVTEADREKNRRVEIIVIRQ